MKVQQVLIVLLLMAFGSIAPSFAQTVRTDYDRNVDFTGYKTYSWGKIQTTTPLWVDRIRNAVDVALAAKGWTLLSTGGEVSITASEITSEHSTLETNYRAGQDWDGGGNGYFEKEYRVGTLIVNLFDSNTKKMIWRGSSGRTLSDESRKNIKSFDKGVQEMFEHFPPEPKG